VPNANYRPDAHTKSKCARCGKEFESKVYKKRRFCSQSCGAKGRPSRKKMASCHPDRPSRMDGLCRPCGDRKKHLWDLYQITPEQWDKMYELQKGLCPVCLNPIYKYGNEHGQRAAQTEHDHKTKQVRGLTCVYCNRYRVGANTLETAKRLVTYLEQDFDGRNL
jgi:hypothetical protein